MTARSDLLRETSAEDAVAPSRARMQAPPESLLVFYRQTLVQVLGLQHRTGALRGALFVAASAVHSLGHAALALAAGRCAAGIVGAFHGSGSGPKGDITLELAAFGLLASLAKGGGGVVAGYEQARIAARVGAKLRLQVLDSWFGAYRSGSAIPLDRGPWTPASSTRSRAPKTAAAGVSALTARVADVEAGLGQGLLAGGRALAQLVPLTAALFWISPPMALAGVGVLAPFALLLSATRGRWRRAYSSAANDGEGLLEAADEAIRHADLWVAYSAEAKARTALAELGDALGRGAARIQAGAAAMSGANEVLAAVALLSALGAAHAGWVGNVDSGRLLAFTVCFFLAYRPIRDLTEARLAWSRGELAFAALRELHPPPRETERVRPAWPLAELVVDRLVLRHGLSAPVSFVVPAGELVAIVGPSGEGKTTLLRTLLGLESARTGAVLYGGTELVSGPGFGRRPFAWVPQDGALLNDTLAANVLLGAADGWDDADGARESDAVRLRALLAPLGGSALLSSTEGKKLGPGGVTVSGGERQRIALARALATSQPILIVDEPTSGLDGPSQASVLGAIGALRGTRSVVFVTHRREPLALAHTIVTFDGAKARVEPGPLFRVATR